MAYSLRSVFKGASIYTIGQMGTKAFGFFLIPVYTRFLTPADYGIVGYLQTLLQLISTVLMFGFYGAQTRYYYESKSSSRKIGEFLFSINIYLILVLLPICGSLTIWGNYLYSLLKVKGIPFHPYLPIVIWTAFFQIINQMVISYYLATKQYKKCAILQFFQFFFVVGMILFFVVYMQQGALGKVKGHLFGQALFFVLFYLAYTKNFTPRFNLVYIKYALAFGVPIVFHLLAGVLQNSIDRVILEKYVSMDQLGIYSLGYEIGMVMYVIVASINRAWQPNYFDLMSSGIDESQKAYEVRRIIFLWILIVGIICLIGILWSREFLILLTPESFHNSAGIASIIILSFFIYGMYFFFGSAIFYFKKTKIFPLLTGSAAFINIFLNLIFIPKFGIYGAAYSTLISFSYQTIATYFIGVHLFNPKFGSESKNILILIFIIIISVFIKDFLDLEIIAQVLKIGYLIIFVIASLLFSKKYNLFKISHIFKIFGSSRINVKNI